MHSEIVKIVSEISSKFDLSYWKDCEGRFPHEYWNELAKAGLFGFLIEKNYGGLELEISELSLAVEETSEHYAGLGSYLFLSGALVSRIFTKLGTEEQKSTLLPKLAKGELKISIALSEEESGLDASAIRTSAISSKDSFILNGQKTFVNNVDLADYLIVFARTSKYDEKKALGTTMFLVDARAAGVRSKKLDRLGMNFVNSFAVELSNVEASSIVGEMNRAWYNIIDIFNCDRILTSSSLIGTGKLALSLASDWARKRTVFGKAIGSNQGIQFPLADAVAEIEAAKVLTSKAALLADKGKSFSNEASCSLLASIKASTLATDRAMQTFGGHGYYKDYHVERLWRDVRAHKVHPISEELLLASIAERSLDLPRSY